MESRHVRSGIRTGFSASQRHRQGSKNRSPALTNRTILVHAGFCGNGGFCRKQKALAGGPQARPRPCSDCSGFSKNSPPRVTVWHNCARRNLTIHPLLPFGLRIHDWCRHVFIVMRCHNRARQNPMVIVLPDTPSSSPLFLLVRHVSPSGTITPDGTSHSLASAIRISDSLLGLPRIRCHELSQPRPTEPLDHCSARYSLFRLVRHVSPFGTVAPDGTSPFICICRSDFWVTSGATTDSLS